MTPFASWVLGLMVGLVPNAPWRGSYSATAQALADAAQRAPLYEGRDKEARTAALLVAIAYHESRFRLNAVGGRGRWLCLFQVARENLGANPRRVLGDAKACVAAAVPLMQQSIRACKSAPEAERLGKYAASTCARGAKSSRTRWALANSLYKEHQDSLPHRVERAL